MSTIITANDLAYTYPNAPEPVFSHVSVTFPRGWTAVLGDNGIGKTTLLRMICGDLAPDSGTITPPAGRLVTAYCEQGIDRPPKNLEDFAADWSSEAITVRQSLDLGEDWPYRYDTLSGGEAKRVGIACAMAANPDVLVLDEPTNHVDEPTRLRIIDAMRRYRGIGIVVSHDVTLIDAVCDRCVMFERRHVHGRNVTVVNTYQGDYDEVSAQIERRDRSDAANLVSARREEARLRAVKADRFQSVQRLEAAKRHGDRIDPKDHDALGAQKALKALGKDATRRYTQLDGRIEASRRKVEGIDTAAKRYEGDLWVDAQASHRSELARLDPARLRETMAARGMPDFRIDVRATSEVDPEHDGEGSVPILPHTLSVGPCDHIGVSGPNGTGKTTLITALLETVGRDVPILSIPQNTTAEDGSRAVAELFGLPAGDKAMVLGAYAQLNADPDDLLAGRSPSPGELRKLLLCLGLLRRPQLIVMDEPTNHLDLNSRQVLARVLADYPGALIVVSHDERFLARCTRMRWRLG